MVESQVGFLYDLATSLSHVKDQSSALILRSSYLMRCKTIIGGNALPEKHFSSKVRCPKCCIEWSNYTNVKVRPLKLSKKQKRRIKSSKRSNTEDYKRKLELLNSIELEQICTFCSNTMVTTALKPKKPLTETKADPNITVAQVNIKDNIQEKSMHKKKTIVKKKKEINVYSNSIDVFSLKNQENTLHSSVKEQPKVIQNSKKKKDKFAGLCQKAVLASAKLKEEKGKQNKLNLFLKPSTS